MKLEKLNIRPIPDVPLESLFLYDNYAFYLPVIDEESSDLARYERR